MAIENIHTVSKRGLTRSFFFCALALSLSGCALSPIGGAAISLVSGTVTGVSDITSNVVGTAVDTTNPDNTRETTE